MKENLGGADLVKGPPAKGHFVNGPWGNCVSVKRILAKKSFGEGKPW